MALPYRDSDCLLAGLAEMAEELRQAIMSMGEVERVELLRRTVAASEMVFGVWPAPDQPQGVGIQVIKGEDVMPPLVGFETAAEITVAAIPCAAREVAIAAREAWRIPRARSEALRSTG